MKLVVGIGNPGKDYVGTRHNVGFEVVDTLARSAGSEVRKKKFLALTGEIQVGHERALLLEPQTYVNNSGLAVRQAVDWLHLSAEDLLVVCDDVHLPLGRLRVRPEGSSGGHKGLQSVIDMLGTERFARLRVGIGSGGEADRVDHVLGRFTAGEREAMEPAIESAARAVSAWIAEGISTCMDQFNAGGQQ